jgi:hypothetical protein
VVRVIAIEETEEDTRKNLQEESERSSSLFFPFLSISILFLSYVYPRSSLSSTSVLFLLSLSLSLGKCI